MTSRKMSFFEFWKSRKERGALLQAANQLRLRPSQQRRLLGDSGVRAALQNTRTASLLPPVGRDVFRRFTQGHEDEEERKSGKKNKEVLEKDGLKPASELEAGKPLPFFYGDPPPKLLYTPLEELDPYYQSQETFITLSKGNIIHRFNAEPACGLLSVSNPLRTAAIKILSHSFFSVFIIVTILINCVFMRLRGAPAYVFIAIYTFETLVKVVGRGVCDGKFTFLRDPWNWLDVVVISTAYLAEFVHFGKLSVLWTVPRVLKLISLSSGLRTTVGALVQSVKRLASVVVLMVFVLSVFAVVSMQLFMGSLRQKCYMVPWTSSNPTFDPDTIPQYDYSGNEVPAFDFKAFQMNDTVCYFLPNQLDALLCGNRSDAGACPEGYLCMRGGRNPNYGFTNYDSFGWALLTMFRLMTQDFWENLVMLTLRADGNRYLIFFMLVVFPGCFCLLSLFLAVVTVTSSEWEEPSVAEAKRNQEEFRQILQALKTREEEEQAAGRADGETKTSHEEEPAEESGDGRRSCPPCCSVLADLFLKWNCCSCWRRLKQWINAFVTNPFFDLGIVICLIVNIILIAMVHYPMSADFDMHLSVAHLVFTAIFTAEMVLRLVAMDPYGYFQVSWHIFDSIIVFLALLELAVADVEGLSVLLRVFRLARWWPSFHAYLKIIWTSLRALKNLILLLLIMVFIFATSGTQMFQKDYKNSVCRITPDCELPRWHMNDFFNTFLLIARIFSGQWIETLWDCMEVSGQATCLIFFMTVVVIVNLLMLHLFLTLLLASFNSDNLVGPEEERENNVHIAVSRGYRAAMKTWILDHFCALQGKNKHVNLDHTAVDSQEEDRKDNLALSSLTSEQRVPVASPESDFEVKMPENEEKEKKCDAVQKHPDVQQDGDSKDRKGDTPEDCCGDKCYRCCPFLDIDTSQGGGRVWSNFRRSCFFIVRNKYFELFIIFIILLSSLALVFEDIHLPQRRVLKMVVETADQVFTYLFLLEMLLKWIGYGFKKYFSDAWCWLDFLILDVFLVCLMANMFGFSQWGAIQSLRTLRALGPLRALSRFQGSRVVVEVLVLSLPFMIDAVLVLNVIWLFFSIAGVDLFAGKFHYCFNETLEEIFLPDAVDNRSECVALVMMNFTEVRWKNLKLNYDSVANGFQSLMQLAASSDIVDLRYAAVDSRQVESQPVYEANPYMSLYFIFFSISSFFSLNFLIRAIINSLQRDKFGGKYVFMTEEQQKFSKAAKTRFFKRPQTPVPRPQSLCRACLFNLVTSVYFEVFMVVLICLNMVPLIVETNDDSWKKEEILYWVLFVFINIFIIEFILKITAFGWRYFTDGWNILDFLLVVYSIVTVFVADIMFMFTPRHLWSVLRLVRIVRILHLRCARGIRKLLVAFVMSLPALFNICLVFWVIMFTFSILGMFNFPYVVKGAGIDDMYNFETFWSSLTCMFMTSTSTGWFGFLLPIMNTPPDCDPWMEHPGMTVRGDCGNQLTGTIFFTTYVILTFVLVLHLYIVVVLQAFSSEDIEVLCDDDLRRFYKTWKKFDPEKSQFIQYSKLSDFCDALRQPLRIPKPNTIKLIHMDLPLFPGDKIHCVDVFATLAAQVLDDSEELGTLKARMEEVVTANSPKVSNEPISSTLQRKQEEVAAKVIQRAYRKHLQQGDTEETAVQSGHGGGGALV